MYIDVFWKFELDREALTPVRTPLSGFTGDMIHPEAVVHLPVEVGAAPRSLKLIMEFVIVSLACVRAVQKQDASTSRVNTISKRRNDDRCEQPEPYEEVEEIALSDSRPGQTVKIGTALSQELRQAILAVLQEYSDIFICHHLAIKPGSRPVKQKQRHLSTDRRDFVHKEVKSLASARYVREVKYPEWLANVILVPKPPAWWMCIDYTNLKKVCPLDPYPFPSIHQMVNKTAGTELHGCF